MYRVSSLGRSCQARTGTKKLNGMHKSQSEVSGITSSLAQQFSKHPNRTVASPGIKHKHFSPAPSSHSLINIKSEKADATQGDFIFYIFAFSGLLCCSSATASQPWLNSPNAPDAVWGSVARKEVELCQWTLSILLTNYFPDCRPNYHNFQKFFWTKKQRCLTLYLPSLNPLDYQCSLSHY